MPLKGCSLTPAVTSNLPRQFMSSLSLGDASVIADHLSGSVSFEILL